jgi:hypothetical protein
MRLDADSKRSGGRIQRPLLSLSSFLLAIAVGITSSFIFSAAYDMARLRLYGERANVSGTWHGAWRGVHAVTIRLEQEGERLGGTVRFSKIVERGDGAKVVGQTNELPLVNARLEGERLSFEVYGLGESCKVMAEMEMNFVDEGEAELRRTNGVSYAGEADAAQVITMRRERSF